MQYMLLFLEGIITFISPCILPMLPIYISYFAGGGERKVTKTVCNALAFVAGFTVVFVLMGALAGTVGSFIATYRTPVNIITGIAVVCFGLSFMGVFQIRFFKGSEFLVKTDNMSVLSAFLFGIIFSVGWTPCVGAFLGSALMLASREGEILKGILMLLIYSVGLGIPFVISAVLIDKLKGTLDCIKRNYKIINTISGGLLIVVGILMATGLLDSVLGMLS